ncbi:MAG: cation:dicarboxylase symporter family transporter [Nitrospirales bacterium]|nr:cation:dicarboxylase symporter family transporter [Nitrospirales bacterium]
MTLSTKVLLGLALGIGTGVFLGEIAAPLQIVGEVFIQLLQMTVLPYVVASLIVGLGRLTYGEAIALAKTGGTLLLVLWAFTLSLVILMPLMFPNWETASLFSTTLVEEKKPFNFVELYIPANPFYSLANNLVPAVVLFSMVMGIALIGVQKKELLLEPLSVLVNVLMKITGFVVQLAPFGIFAIAASAAGTMNVEEVGRWQIYLLAYVVVWALLTFWVLPAFVTSLTPLTYRDVLGHTKDVLITAFATGNLLIVLPMLVEKSKELLAKYDLRTEEAHSAVGVIVPTAFTFPNCGKLLTLSFILFAGWFADVPIAIQEYPAFLSVGAL